MSLRRVLFVALVAVLLCGVASASASSVDAWSTPDVDAAWPVELDVTSALAKEVQARHAEFLMAETGGSSSSSTGVEESSSTGPIVPPVDEPTYQNATLAVEFAGLFPNAGQDILDAIFRATGFPNTTLGELISAITELYCDGAICPVASASSTGAAAAESSTAPAGRRLLEVITTSGQVTKVTVLMSPGSPTDATASKVSTFFAAVLGCGSNDTCVEALAAQSGFQAVALPDTLAAAVIPGTIAVENGLLTGGEVTGAPTVGTDGDARRTNGGYYFLAAVLALFIVIAALYFAMHKRAEPAVVRKDDRYAASGAELAPVVAAPAGAAVAVPAANSGVVVQDEAAPLGGNQQQMDYRSVFALKHNVLEKNAAEAKAEDEHNHNDVHFILHQ